MKNSIKIINLTPHEINLNNGDSFPPSGQVARVTQYFSGFDDLLIALQEFGPIDGLPEFKKGVYLICSGFVLAAAKSQGRTDVIAPATGHPEVIRNEKGHIVSVPGFVQ